MRQQTSGASLALAVRKTAHNPEPCLIGIDGDHLPAASQIALHRDVDVTELRVAIGMVRALLGFAIALQAVVQIVQDLGYFGVADRMLAPGQGLRNRPCALACPAQIGKTIRAACCVFTLLPLPNMFAAGALYGIGGHLFC
jgi:hypothetical protein